MAGPLLLFAGIVWNAKRLVVLQSQPQTGSDERIARRPRPHLQNSVAG